MTTAKDWAELVSMKKPSGVEFSDKTLSPYKYVIGDAVLTDTGCVRISILEGCVLQPEMAIALRDWLLELFPK